MLSVLRQLAEIGKDENELIIITERLLELKPDDVGLRFSLAYKHVALANYLKVPHHERNSMVWNNLGVAYDHFQLRRKAVTAYQKSEEMGETLATSNLANKLMNVGMNDEAQLKLERALSIKDYHKNVLESLSRLREIPDEEEKKLEALLDRIKPKQEFYALIARAITDVTPEVLADRWTCPDCSLEMSLSNGEFNLNGTYEVDENVFAPYLGIASRKIKQRVEYRGKLLGHTVIGIVKRTKEKGDATPAPTGLLGAGEADSTVLMALSDDRTEFRVMENPYTTGPRFYSIRQLSSIAKSD